jgi:ribosome-associated protein
MTDGRESPSTAMSDDATRSGPAPGDDATAVATAAARAADEKQGRDIVVIDVNRVLGITDLFVIVSAPNRRLVRTLVDEIEHAVRAATGRSPLRVEGVREQQWVLLDYGDTVVHVFLDETRQFYEIERLYRDAPKVAWAS